MLLLSAALALASEATLLGWVHLDARQHAAAAADARRALAEDPHDLEAHRLYTSAAMREWRNRDAVLGTYRSWHEHEPELPAARFGLAAALRAYGDDANCDEITTLIGDVAGPPADAYQQLRVLLSASSWCDGIDADAVVAQLLEVGADPAATGSAVGWAIRRRLDDDGFGEDAVALVDRAVDANPGRLDSLASAAWDGKGKHARAAREALLRHAEAFAASDSLGRRWLALDVFETAKDARAEALREALEAADPPAPMPYTPPTERMSEIYDADKKPTHELALAALEALDLPDDAPERAAWLRKRIDRMEALGRTDGLYALVRERARLEPDNGTAVNDWAYEAALRGEDLEEALAAITAVLDEEPRWTPSRGAYAQWAEGATWSRAVRLDTQGWLLHLLGRHDEAREPLLNAVRLAPDEGTLHGHLAAVYAALDEPESAFAHYTEALVHGVDDGEAELAAQVRSAVEAAWIERGHWHPDGLDGWLEDRRAADAGDAPRAPEPEHALVGQAFPLDVVDALRGGSVDLGDHDGPLVVDVWATWCGPCVRGMPHLQEVAAAYAEDGVRVVGLSVDEKKAPAIKFYRGAEGIAYELAWIGKSGFDALQINSIPSLFVVDADGVVVEMIRGYGGTVDHRLEEALDDVLGG